MQNLNNLDIIILIIVGISALIALSRGLVKEVLSIIGWVLGTCAVIYLLPELMPFAKQHISNGYVAGAVTSVCILILFFIIWIYTTSGIVSKIRTSKLNGMDRFLGLFFGIARAFLLIILFNILINWMIPADKQSSSLTESKYFQLAGSFAKPIEDLIPEETIELIKSKTIAHEHAEEKEETEEQNSDTDILFEKLTQPQIKKINTDKVNSKQEEKGYRESERDNLDRLIENVE
ncbi:MAG: CvpA family protein [Alphaproteobacteria bacterium]|nr:CvpA family protein [Alphaproteobacteria bacterium]